MTGEESAAIEHPNHYTWHPHAECIAVTQWFNFNLGNVIKYVWRAGKKGSDTTREDLLKARQYIDFELARIGDVEPAKVVEIQKGINKMLGVSGWVSDYRCADEDLTNDEFHRRNAVGKRPHEAHRCGPSLGQWCDGYL